MDVEPWLQLVVQVPLVAAFMWFALQQQKRESAERIQRDAEWRQFLLDQRMATLTSLDVFAAQLQKVSEALVSIDRRTERIEDTFVLHDTRAEGIAVSLAELKQGKYAPV